MELGFLIITVLASVVGGIVCARKYGSKIHGAFGAAWTFFAAGGLFWLLDLVRS